jgi:hypothetical protein
MARYQYVGINFGMCAEIRARNGRLLATTRLRPCGYETAVDQDICDMADERGWRIAGETKPARKAVAQ